MILPIDALSRRRSEAALGARVRCGSGDGGSSCAENQAQDRPARRQPRKLAGPFRKKLSSHTPLDPGRPSGPRAPPRRRYRRSRRSKRSGTVSSQIAIRTTAARAPSSGPCSPRRITPKFRSSKRPPAPERSNGKTAGRPFEIDGSGGVVCDTMHGEGSIVHRGGIDCDGGPVRMPVAGERPDIKSNICRLTPGQCRQGRLPGSMMTSAVRSRTFLDPQPRQQVGAVLSPGNALPTPTARPWPRPVRKSLRPSTPSPTISKFPMRYRAVQRPASPSDESIQLHSTFGTSR